VARRPSLRAAGCRQRLGLQPRQRPGVLPAQGAGAAALPGPASAEPEAPAEPAPAPASDEPAAPELAVPGMASPCPASCGLGAGDGAGDASPGASSDPTPSTKASSHLGDAECPEASAPSPSLDAVRKVCVEVEEDDGSPEEAPAPAEPPPQGTAPDATLAPEPGVGAVQEARGAGGRLPPGRRISWVLHGSRWRQVFLDGPGPRCRSAGAAKGRAPPTPGVIGRLRKGSIGSISTCSDGCTDASARSDGSSACDQGRPAALGAAPAPVQASSDSCTPQRNAAAAALRMAIRLDGPCCLPSPGLAALELCSPPGSASTGSQLASQDAECRRLLEEWDSTMDAVKAAACQDLPSPTAAAPGGGEEQDELEQRKRSLAEQHEQLQQKAGAHSQRTPPPEGMAASGPDG